MKVVCDREKLREGLAVANNVIPAKSAKPVLENVYLVANDEGLELAGTDLEAIKTATETLMTASQTFAQQLYEQAAAEQQAAGGGGDASADPTAADDDVVDAEIVDDEEQ